MRNPANKQTNKQTNRHTKVIAISRFSRDNKAPVRRIAIVMNTNSPFSGSYIENPFWYQQFDFRQIRLLRRCQSIVDIDAADNCRLYVTTMKAMIFQDDISSYPIDFFKDHYVLVFDLTSFPDAIEKSLHPNTQN